MIDQINHTVRVRVLKLRRVCMWYVRLRERARVCVCVRERERERERVFHTTLNARFENQAGIISTNNSVPHITCMQHSTLAKSFGMIVYKW